MIFDKYEPYNYNILIYDPMHVRVHNQYCKVRFNYVLAQTLYINNIKHVGDIELSYQHSSNTEISNNHIHYNVMYNIKHPEDIQHPLQQWFLSYINDNPTLYTIHIMNEYIQEHYNGMQIYSPELIELFTFIINFNCNKTHVTLNDYQS